MLETLQNRLATLERQMQNVTETYKYATELQQKALQEGLVLQGRIAEIKNLLGATNESGAMDQSIIQE